jgi:hypothetical protein
MTQNPEVVPVETRDILAVEALYGNNEEDQHAEEGAHGGADYFCAQAV